MSRALGEKKSHGRGSHKVTVLEKGTTPSFQQETKRGKKNCTSPGGVGFRNREKRRDVLKGGVFGWGAEHQRMLADVRLPQGDFKLERGNGARSVAGRKWRERRGREVHFEGPF